MLRYIPTVLLHRSSSCCIYNYPILFQKRNYRSLIYSPINYENPLITQKMPNLVSLTGHQLRVGLSTRSHSIRLRINTPNREKMSRYRWNSKKIGGLICFSFSVSSMAHAEASMGRNDYNKNNKNEGSATSHGKKVYTDYSVTGIPGDGRCLFRSVAHGACIRSGKPLPNQEQQRQLADELRAKVADEFVKRRAETEWFVEGDFDTYVSQIRKPHVWGGEPELFMASHVLQMPITVYMHDEESGGLIAIAEYGQEYGKDDPIRVLYHGFGHYDALHFPSINQGSPKSRL